MRTRRGTHASAWLVATLVGALATAAFAHDPAAEGEAQEAAGPNTGRISLFVQNDFSNAYFFRGILNERHGLVWQPWAELYVSLYESEDGPIRGVTVGGGVWNSVHTKRTLAENSPRSLYETDWYPLLTIDFAGGLSFTTVYYFYTSPNGAFDTVEEANFKLSWDDSEVLGRWALAPWANLAVETERTSFGDDEGIGLQLGIGPTLFALEGESFPLSVTVPVEVGLSLGDYYEEPGRSDREFGYLSAGLLASLPLPFVPADFGEWTLSVGAKGFYFSNALTRANRGERFYPQVTGSLSLSY